MAFTLPGFTSGNIACLFRSGYGPVASGSTGISTATRQLAMVFTAEYTQNLTGCLIFHANNGGSPTGCQVDLYAVDSGGLPTGASLATSTYTPTASAVNTVTFSVAAAVTAGVSYALVWKNTTATPGTNFYTLCTASNVDAHYGSSVTVRSEDSGATWANTNAGAFLASGAMAPTYASAGSRCEALVGSTSVGTGTPLYNTSGVRTARSGIKVNFTSAVRLWGVSFLLSLKTGTPTHTLQAEVCSSSASLIVSDTVVNCAAAQGTNMCCFSGGYPLAANTDYYIMVTPVLATAGDVSNSVAVQEGGYVLQAPTIGPIKGGYTSTASGAPSFSAISTTVPFMDVWIEPTITGAAAAVTVGSVASS